MLAFVVVAPSLLHRSSTDNVPQFTGCCGDPKVNSRYYGQLPPHLRKHKWELVEHISGRWPDTLRDGSHIVVSTTSPPDVRHHHPNGHPRRSAPCGRVFAGRARRERHPVPITLIPPIGPW